MEKSTRVLRILLIGCIVSTSLNIWGQNVTIINNYSGRSEEYDDENLVLKNVTEHTYIINEFEPSNTNAQNQLEVMISFGLRSHVDNVYRTENGNVIALESGSELNQSATAIVQNALWINDENFKTFPGFSKDVEKLAEELRSINGYNAQFGDNDLREPRDGKIGLYIFQRMVYELKKACEEEVSAFLSENLPEPDIVVQNPDGNGQMLNPGDYQIERNNQNDQNLADIKLNPEDLFEPEKKDRKKNKRRRKDEQTLFNERIVQLLEENNRILANYNTRFEDLQNQIDDIRRNGGSNDDVKEEIAELRGMIIDLANGREVRERDGSRTRLVNDQILTVYFEMNQHQLTLAQKASLNRVKAELQSNPGYTAVITGYADKTGDANLNAWISRKRASAVRDYLLSQGVPRTRMVINYLGDEQSLSPNPADRKVEVQYILNYTVQE